MRPRTTPARTAHESEVLFAPGSRFLVESKIEVSPGNWVIKMSDVG